MISMNTFSRMTVCATKQDIIDNQALIERIHGEGFYQFSFSDYTKMDGLLEELSDALNQPVFSGWHAITPALPNEASPVSYSGLFGHEAFPLHTDMAHWKLPPRYLVLWARKAAASVQTPLLDSFKLISEVGQSLLFRTLVRPRRPIHGRLPLMRIVDKMPNEQWLFRWDSVFLRPASDAGQVGVSALLAAIDRFEKVEFSLEDEGRGVVIDNWRLLHGRSPVPPEGKTRIIMRAYLGQAA